MRKQKVECFKGTPKYIEGADAFKESGHVDDRYPDAKHLTGPERLAWLQGWLDTMIATKFPQYFEKP